MKRIMFAVAGLALAACAASQPAPPNAQEPASPLSPGAPPPATPAAAPTAPPPPMAPAAAPTAPPPPMGAPVWVTAIDDWAKTVCACPDSNCASDAASKIITPNMSDAGLLAQWMPHYQAAMAKGAGCIAQLRAARK
jgi:hypothetical protein